ncbi:conserved hypothetical protein [Tenacibaculum maritimum]|uniref:phage baseplate protein n=1 Tax=Tenacibaculum maritimum TaxID=107401 RepID=UPI0012E3FFB2|nr:hypothetical protein [Tenacibaculum maritimum]CAA0249571.1 conserved hypothetical protein [Tenacibaculum maritimum]
MNNLNFQELGGFPLETNTLTEVQKAYSIFNNYGSLAGNKTIITGCEEIGNSVTNGFIYLNDELLEFRGGTKQSKIIIKQEIQEVEFEDKTIKPVYYTRYAAFGTGVNAVKWSDFKKIHPLKSLMSRIEKLEKFALPFSQGGSMVFWNKPANEIPEGWREAIDWRGRVPVGYDINQYEFNQIGKIGGEKTHKLINDEIPDHNHPMKLMTGAHYKSKIKQYAGSGAKTRNTTLTDTLDLQNTESAGGGEPHNNLQPYRVVIFIEPII